MALWGIIIAINIASFIFAAVTIWRVFHNFVKKYPMPESKYTLLFRFISIKQAAICYVLVLFIIMTVSFALTYLTTG